MSQLKTISWTNPATAVAKNVSVGFDVARVQTIDVTAGGSFMWVYGMPNGYFLNLASGAITTTNGFTPASQDALFGAPITAVTRAADTVFTCSYLDQFNFLVGDVVNANAISDDATGTTLNGQYTVLSVSAAAVTCSESTASGFSAWVSGGFLVKVKNSLGVPYPTLNVGIQGGTLGTGMVGANSSEMVAVFEGSNSVV
jgi:hypothetical protein